MASAAVQYDNINVIQEAPTFRPTMEEFMDFKKYIESIEPLCRHSGIAKIVPPEEWNKDFSYENIELTIPAPIKQYVTGTTPGIYEVLLVESEGLTVNDFKEAALKEKVPKSAKYDYDSIERTFWKNIRFNPPMYGADMSGTLFNKDVKYWNLQKLDSILRLLDAQLPGITRPYLYWGMWKAMFAWHVEDMNLASINYLHFGEPKCWYGIPPEHGARFERIMQSYFPDQFQKCSEFLRHKMYMVSPHILTSKHKIPIVKAVQEKGQFMITFPYAYHCGFNTGFNCAESVNFAMESWLEMGRKAKSCKCDSDTVKINIDVLTERLRLYKEGQLDIEAEEQRSMEQYEAMLANQAAFEQMPQRRMMAPVSKSPKKNSKSPTKKQKISEEESVVAASPPSDPVEEQEVKQTKQDDSDEGEAKARRKNKHLTTEELQILEAAFIMYNGTIDREGKERLAQELNWTCTGVYNWFRRKRIATTGSPATKKESDLHDTGSPSNDKPVLRHPISALRSHPATSPEDLAFTMKTPWFLRAKGNKRSLWS